MKETSIITGSSREFLAFMKTKFPLIHMSNVFLRDFHYGSMEYLASKGKKLKYLDAEQVAGEVVTHLETQGILRKIDHQSWLLNYPEFALPRPEAKPDPKASPKPETNIEQKTA